MAFQMEMETYDELRLSITCLIGLNALLSCIDDVPGEDKRTIETIKGILVKIQDKELRHMRKCLNECEGGRTQ